MGTGDEVVKALQAKAFTSSSTIGLMVVAMAAAGVLYGFDVIDRDALSSVLGMGVLGIVQRIRTKAPVALSWRKPDDPV